MNILGVAGKIFCSNPVSFVLGAGVGLVGLYLIDKIEEQRKLEKMQREIEATVKALEGQLKALPQETKTEVKEIKEAAKETKK
jgi:uncharacterized protein HemX